MPRNINWKMEEVDSSNIKARGYDAKSQKMRIQFRSGLYEYSNVSPEFYKEFQAAESAGKFFAEHKAGLTDFIKLS